jgi:peptidoglycan/LPS O-acetylase OafA/YrhL
VKYYPKIDGLRCVAILFVLVSHFAKPVGKYISAGYYGVDLFFVISGFLITLVLLNSGKKTFQANYVNFMGRRTLRIFPLYYLALFILWLTNEPVVHSNLPWLVSYTYNYAHVLYKVPDSPVTHFWSLAVEEQFYLLWPFAVLFLKDKPGVLFWLILVIICFGYAQTVFGFIGPLERFNYVGIHSRMASLGLGALGAVLSYNNRLPEDFLKDKYYEYTMYAILLISLTTSFKFKVVILGLCSLYLVLKAAYFGFHAGITGRFLSHPWVVRIGIVSYGIYIFHYPLGYFFNQYIMPTWLTVFNEIIPGENSQSANYSWMITFPIYSFLSVLTAEMSFRMIESPIAKLKSAMFRY